MLVWFSQGQRYFDMKFFTQDDEATLNERRLLSRYGVWLLVIRISLKKKN